jgi:hypothetical protein
VLLKTAYRLLPPLDEDLLPDDRLPLPDDRLTLPDDLLGEEDR